jgi:hypothetical protein
MADPITRAEDMALEFKRRLEGIRMAEGCETDVGVRVFLGRRSISPEMMPCVSIIEADDAVSDQPARMGQVLISQHYVIMAYQACDPDNPNTVAHAAIRDMKRALWMTNGKFDPMLGGACRKLDYKGRDIAPRADGSSEVVCAIEATADFVETLYNP